MLFLIDYDRKLGLQQMQTFEDTERERAHAIRFELELKHFRAKIDREVVLLEAENEEAIRVTDGRYFYTLEELTQKLAAALTREITKWQ